ncbi:hypothetical protein [Plantactinospora sp. KBS50]|uniref:hypothetical protein n=1 Tax=Plantactinospora sp. KBS50 TaxID=2024580 RepID=UPI000BAADF3D|nr:hypothetical protein [Plantactinospora sp. KBS50]ASW53711.1 hypothetical protein CIK06_05145 [Plantactinospora sp. KBS50]
MRHVNSVLLSLILAPSIWALSGYGLQTYGPVGTGPDGRIPLDRLVALGALLGAATLFAVLLLARLSPLGPALTGLTYLGATGLVAGYPALARHAVGRLPLGFGPELLRPAGGLAVLLGLPLLATAFSGRRWRRFTGLPALYDPPVSPAAGDHPPADATTTAMYSPPAGAGPWTAAASWPPPASDQPPPWPPWRAWHSDPGRNADTADLTAQLEPLRRPAPPG